MPITPLDIVGKQIESAAKNQMRSAQAELLRETSIVGQANARLGKALNALTNNKNNKKNSRAGRTRLDGVYVQERSVITAPDGYVRRSPVQSLRVPSDYYPRLIRRAIGAAIVVLLLAGTAILLIQYLL